jgi:hypothetical protein
MLRAHELDWRGPLKGATIAPGSVGWASEPSGLTFTSLTIAGDRTLVDISHPATTHPIDYLVRCKLTDSAGFIHETEPPIELRVTPGGAYDGELLMNCPLLEVPTKILSLVLLVPSFENPDTPPGEVPSGGFTYESIRFPGSDHSIPLFDFGDRTQERDWSLTYVEAMSGGEVWETLDGFVSVQFIDTPTYPDATSGCGPGPGGAFPTPDGYTIFKWEVTGTPRDDETTPTDLTLNIRLTATDELIETAIGTHCASFPFEFDVWWIP